MDLKIGRWAKVLVNYSCNIQRGEWVYLVTNCIEAKPLYDAVRAEILRKGAHVSDHFAYDPCGCTRTGIQHDHLFLSEASMQQLDLVPPFKMAELNAMQAVIVIEGNSDPELTQYIPYGKYPRRMRALEPFIDERAKKKWILTNYPTDVFARNSGLPLRELRKFIYSALFLDGSNPVAEWQRVSCAQAKLIKFLEGVKLVRIKGKQSDLVLSVAGRKWANCDGHYNLPDGEIFTGPIEDSADGIIYFGDFPVVCGGSEISGIKLTFRSGRVVEASARKGNEYLQEILRTDRGASYLGELGIGTNFGIQRPTREILFDEKIGGTIHLALGSGFPEVGGRNKSAIHQDIVKPLGIFNPADPDRAELLVEKDGCWFRLVKGREGLAFERV